jgi:hypothetical protein
MYFNKWLAKQLEGLPITRKELSKLSGVSYSNMNGAKRFSPRIANLVLICEVLNRVKGGTLLDLNQLIIAAIAHSGVEYPFAVRRLKE